MQNARTLGLFLLVFLGPLLLLRVACVSNREICENARGRYGEIASMHTCLMPHGEACPITYRWNEAGGGCTSRRALPGVWRWETW
jgi:hypothetical protein